MGIGLLTKLEPYSSSIFSVGTKTSLLVFKVESITYSLTAAFWPLGKPSVPLRPRNSWPLAAPRCSWWYPLATVVSATTEFPRKWSGCVTIWQTRVINWVVKQWFYHLGNGGCPAIFHCLIIEKYCPVIIRDILNQY